MSHRRIDRKSRSLRHRSRKLGEGSRLEKEKERGSRQECDWKEHRDESGNEEKED